MRRRAYATLTREELTRLFSFKDVEVVAIAHDFERDVFLLYLRGGKLPEMEEGEQSMRITMEIVKPAEVKLNI